MCQKYIILLFIWRCLKLYSSQSTASNITISSEEFELPSIFVLNLDRAPNRWKSAEEEMMVAGLQIQRLSAIDGRNLTNLELRSSSTLLSTFLQPRGVIGCYLSHRKFWRMVVDQDLENAIVFEDDVKLVANFKPLLVERLKRLKEDKFDYDVILLGAIGMVHPQGHHTWGARLFSSYMGGTRKLKRLSDYLYQPVRPAGTHAYLLSRSGAQKLLSLCPRAVFHVDLDAWRHADLKILMIDPMLAYQTFESTTLTDVSTGHGLVRMAKRHYLFKAFERFAFDNYTHQTLSHVLAEPLLQIGPGGPVLTVERHLAVLVGGSMLSTMLQALGRTTAARTVLALLTAFTAAVRGTIFLLMNWK